MVPLIIIPALCLTPAVILIIIRAPALLSMARSAEEMVTCITVTGLMAQPEEITALMDVRITAFIQTPVNRRHPVVPIREETVIQPAVERAMNQSRILADACPEHLVADIFPSAVTHRANIVHLPVVPAVFRLPTPVLCPSNAVNRRPYPVVPVRAELAVRLPAVAHQVIR